MKLAAKYIALCHTGVISWPESGLVLAAQLFVIGHDCGHRSFSKDKLLEDIVGTLAFMPLIYPFEPWRIKHNHHHAHTNKCAQEARILCATLGLSLVAGSRTWGLTQSLLLIRAMCILKVLPECAAVWLAYVCRIKCSASCLVCTLSHMTLCGRNNTGILVSAQHQGCNQGRHKGWTLVPNTRADPQAGGGHCMAPRAQGGGGQVGPHAVVRVQDVPGLPAEAVGLGRPLAHLALQPGPVHGEAAAAGAVTLNPKPYMCVILGV